MKWIAIAAIMVSTVAVSAQTAKPIPATSTVFYLTNDGPTWDEHKYDVAIIDAYFKKHPGEHGEYLWVYRDLVTGHYLRIDRTGKITRRGISKSDVLLMIIANDMANRFMGAGDY